MTITTSTLADLLSAKRVLLNEKACSKKLLLEKASLILAKSLETFSSQDILIALVEREKLGSTAIGHGVAIPHARLANLAHPIACLIRLETAIDFEASDDEPVSLFFILLVPEDTASQHLQLLAKLAHVLKNDAIRATLKYTDDIDKLLEALRDYAVV